jgi:hypothetical protein
LWKSGQSWFEFYEKKLAMLPLREEESADRIRELTMEYYMELRRALLTVSLPASNLNCYCMPELKDICRQHRSAARSGGANHGRARDSAPGQKAVAIILTI